jgi:hypothetical protein
MPDDRRPDHGSVSDTDIESLLRELRPDDFVFSAPPASIWASIEAHRHVGVAHRSRRRTSTSLMLAAAAVSLVVAAAVVLTATGGSEPAVVAIAALTHDTETFDPLGAAATASARLVDRDGSLEIVIDEARLPELDGDLELELWMLAADEAGAVVDVAPVARLSGPGTYAVPSDIDVGTHRIIDISVEPRDGDADHSGRSILRGTLADT